MGTEEGEKGAARIDYVLANQVGDNLVVEARYDYEMAVADHVPHVIRIKAGRGDDEACVRQRVATFKSPEDRANEWDEEWANSKEANETFRGCFSDVKRDFEDAVEKGNLSAAHHLWSKAAEKYLMERIGLENPQEIQNLFRRGKHLKYQKEKVHQANLGEGEAEIGGAWKHQRRLKDLQRKIIAGEKRREWKMGTGEGGGAYL